MSLQENRFFNNVQYRQTVRTAYRLSFAAALSQRPGLPGTFARRLQFRKMPSGASVNFEGGRICMEKLKRYIVFLIGLFINSLGVSLITKADLGTSPISSIPYVLSLNFPFTLGQFTIVFSLLLIVIQLIILRRNFKPEHLLQIPISILFGYFIDLTMVMLFFVHPGNYLSSLAYLLVGCVILGFGVYTEVLANVAMLPGESFVRAVSSTWKTEFGATKVAFDVSLTVIAGSALIPVRTPAGRSAGRYDYSGSAGGLYCPAVRAQAFLSGVAPFFRRSGRIQERMPEMCPRKKKRLHPGVL